MRSTPTLTVRDNIGFALKLAKTPRPKSTRVEEAARILELTEQLGKRPGQLSGGQRQRVAMGRAIVRQPSAFLMDEPLSNLDAKLARADAAEIARLQRDLGVTTVYVTHDQVEAMTMGDRVCVLKDGYLQQVDTPQNLYDKPDNVFVAAFIGSPSMNLNEGTLAGTTLTFGSHTIELSADVFEKRPGLKEFDGKGIIVGIRPEDLEGRKPCPRGEEGGRPSPPPAHSPRRSARRSSCTSSSTLPASTPATPTPSTTSASTQRSAASIHEAR